MPISRVMPQGPGRAAPKPVCSLSAPLRPADAPRLEDTDCPRSWTWPEGPEQTLRCEARGNPAPSVHCARPDGGAVLALGLLGPVTRALAGTYRCTAANVQGEAVRDVTLTVECESEEEKPRARMWGEWVLPPWIWLEGWRTCPAAWGVTLGGTFPGGRSMGAVRGEEEEREGIKRVSLNPQVSR